MLTIEAINTAKRILKANDNGLPTMREPVRLPASLYDKAEAAGLDMTGYVKIKRTPVD